MESSSLWKKIPADIDKRLKTSMERAVEQSPGKVNVFFRADDIGVPDREWERLTNIFLRHQVPLAAAVVPAWITLSRWRALFKMGQEAPSLWCWHQHGFRHVNHETSGKKQEFGPGRNAEDIHADIDAGREWLETILGEAFTPVFTPPWNRCGMAALEHLQASGYRAVSRDQGSRPEPPEGLPDWFVNIDLHTRKEISSEASWEALFAEFSQALSAGRAGIMIHHLRMNDAAFEFFNLLLPEIKRNKKIRIVNWRDREYPASVSDAL